MNKYILLDIYDLIKKTLVHLQNKDIEKAEKDLTEAFNLYKEVLDKKD